MAIYDKNGKRNLDAENNVINGVLGMIPAALVGGPVGAIASLVAGLFCANKNLKKSESRHDLYDKARLEEMERWRAKDHWDLEDENELCGSLAREFNKRESKRLDVKMYSGYSMGVTQTTSYRYPLYNLYTDEHVGDIEYIAIRSFYRRFGDRLDEVVRYDLYKPSNFDGQLKRVPGLMPSWAYYIDGIYYIPTNEPLGIKYYS